MKRGIELCGAPLVMLAMGACSTVSQHPAPTPAASLPVTDATKVDPSSQQAQPTIVKQQRRPAVLGENRVGAQMIGNVAIDARWSNYGAYLQAMIQTVQMQWERLLMQNLELANPAFGRTVKVKFLLNSEGRVARILKVGTTANTYVTRACVSAITDRAPYGPWTDDMKAVLGTEQEITFTFYHQ